MIQGLFPNARNEIAAAFLPHDARCLPYDCIARDKIEAQRAALALQGLTMQDPGLVLPLLCVISDLMIPSWDTGEGGDAP